MAFGDITVTAVVAFLLILNVTHAEDTEAEGGSCELACNKYVKPIKAHSAFHVSLAENASTHFRHPVQFENVDLNIGGHWDKEKNVFTCEIPGVYMFTANIMKPEDCPSATAMITKSKDDTLKKMDHDASAYVYGSVGIESSASGSTLLQLERGDLVYLIISGGSCIKGDSIKSTNFSGILLYPDA
ncbi:complement C1q-like protein 3 [Ptychodera flava]|uniref:complement C1q-like protein 3 n=1 Tax=Ptychodera flava TaxID=63121 RepID=UPI003969E8D5